MRDQRRNGRQNYSEKETLYNFSVSGISFSTPYIEHGMIIKWKVTEYWMLSISF